MDILLLNLPTNAWYKKELNESSGMPPLGLMYIGTVLEEQGYSVKLIDFCADSMSEDDFEKYLLSESPSLIGLSTYNEAWLSLKVIASKIKSINDNIKIVAGGAFATFTYKDILSQTDVDIVSIGEGEYSILEISDALIKGTKDLEQVQGIVYKQNNEIIDVNAKYNRIKNLDELPYPNRNLINIEKYSVPFTLSTARGCPGDCIFCSSRSFWGNKVYMRGAENIFGEIMYLYNNYNANYFQIADDTFTASKKRAISVCNKIIDSGIQFIWGCETRADVIDEEFVKIMKKAGCNKLQIGLESADNDVLRKIKKKVTIEQIENALKIAYENGMYITLSFIVGHAVDTKESINKTIEFAKMAKEKYGASITGSINTPFIGTEQYDKRDELGIKIKSYEWDDFRLDNPNIGTKQFELNELRKYYYEITELCSS